MTKTLHSLVICLALAGLILLSACSILPTPPNIKDVEWRWQSWQSPQDARLNYVSNPDQFTLTLQPGNKLALHNDCNSAGGEYMLSGSKLSLKVTISTEAYCGDASLDRLFIEMLRQVKSYYVENGWLVLELADGTLMSFSQ